MSYASLRSDRPRVVWVSSKPLTSALDSATWLETTRVLREQGWHITLLGSGVTGRQEVQGVEVYSLSEPRVYLLGTLLFHARVVSLLMRQWTVIDLVLFHQMSAPWLLPLRFLRKWLGRERPLFVMDTRDLAVVRSDLRNRLRRLFLRWAHWLANRWADGQTAITSRMAQLVGIPDAQLWGTWPSGVDLERFGPAQAGREWPGEGEPIHLMYIGSFASDRNLTLLCRAVGQANAEGLGFVLSLVGNGPERPALEEAALCAAGSIHIRPPVPHSQIPNLLRQVHVGVTSLPSSHDSKFEASSPIKLFEYMAAGLPVMATDNACHTDVVGGGSYAFWVRGASEQGMLAALRLVAQVRASLADKGAEAAAAARAWSWQEAGRKLGMALEHGLQGRSETLEAGARGRGSGSDLRDQEDAGVLGIQG